MRRRVMPVRVQVCRAVQECHHVGSMSVPVGAGLAGYGLVRGSQLLIGWIWRARPPAGPGRGGRRVHGGGEAAQGPARAVGGQGQRRHLRPGVGEFAALAGVLVADAKVGRLLSHAERLQHRAVRIAQRDDQMPGERGIVQPVVNQREVGWRR